MYSISLKILEMLPRKEAGTKPETQIFARWVWEPLLWESPVTLEHFYSSTHWTWNLINAQSGGQAGLFGPLFGLLTLVSPSVLVPKAVLEAASLQCLGCSRFLYRNRKPAWKRPCCCRESTARVVLCASSRHS